MKQKQRRQRTAGIRKQERDRKKACRPKPFKPLTTLELIAYAEKAVEIHKGYVAEDTQKTAIAFKKFLICSLFYVIMVTFAIVSPHTSRDAKQSVAAGLTCVLVLPLMWWLFYRSSKKRWTKYLQESVEYLEQLRIRVQDS